MNKKNVFRGCALRIVIGITVLALLLLGGASANPVTDSNNQNGLRGDYYNSPIYRNDVNAVATPDATRIDPNININWNDGYNRNDSDYLSFTFALSGAKEWKRILAPKLSYYMWQKA